MLDAVVLEDLLTDLSLSTGYGVFFVDQNALKLIGDHELREAAACAGCPFLAPAVCFDHWVAPGEKKCVSCCPGGRLFACLSLFSDGVPTGSLILGPLGVEAAEDPRRTKALLSVMDALALRMEQLGLLMRRNDLFARLSHYICEHLTDELSGKALHHALYASESSLVHAVKRETGMPLRLYIQARRLEAARLMLLGTSMTVMQVAEKCGINDFNYFARIFKKRYGMPPSALRRRENLHMPVCCSSETTACNKSQVKKQNGA